MFPSFNFLGRTIGTYSLVTIIGIVLAAVLVFLLLKKSGAVIENIIFAGLSAVAGMLVGGHFLFGLTRLPDFFKVMGNQYIAPNTFLEFVDLVMQTFGGMVFYGGLFGGIIGIYLYCHFTHKNKRLYLNAFAPGLSLIHAFGRVGCFLAGCCYGVEYHGFLHVDYPEEAIIGSANADITAFSRFPVQLLESLAELLITLTLIILFKKFKTKYSLIKVYLFLYSIVRFFR